MMPWTEPARSDAQKGGRPNNTQFSVTWLGGKAYTEIRRFVIVHEGHGNSLCCPIHTYGNQATLKPNLSEPDQHTIIHTAEQCPPVHSYTDKHGNTISEELPLDPIRVTSERNDAEGQLHPLSRLNYSKIYTIEHFVRVLNIGLVQSGWMDSLLASSPVKLPASKGPRRSSQPSGHHKSHPKDPRRKRKDGH